MLIRAVLAMGAGVAVALLVDGWHGRIQFARLLGIACMSWAMTELLIAWRTRARQREEEDLTRGSGSQ